MLASQATREGVASLYREGARRRILEGEREISFFRKRGAWRPLKWVTCHVARVFKPFHIHILINKKSKAKM